MGAEPPKRSPSRKVDPPKPVLVNLYRVWPAGGPRGDVDGGLDVLAVVPGELLMWHRTNTGHWLGYVQFSVRAGSGDGGTRMWQWVHADALRPQPGPAVGRQD